MELELGKMDEVVSLEEIGMLVCKVVVGLTVVRVNVETGRDGVGEMVEENSVVVRVKESEKEVTREVVLIEVELIKMESELEDIPIVIAPEEI